MELFEFMKKRRSVREYTTEEYIRSLLGFQQEYKLEAILSIEMPANHPGPHKMEELLKQEIER